MSLRLATRSSNLALWQAEATQRALEAALPGQVAELVPLKSSGDLDTTTALARFGRIGIFTVEVDRAVLDGRADVGVHSLKDMTTTLQDGVVLAAVLPRGPVEDVLVADPGTTLDNLPEGARVATGSLRRRAMLLAARPDLEIVDIRGNVETRLSKLARGDAHALLMARAGLERLGYTDAIAEVLDTRRFLPATGQGIVGLTCREGDTETLDKLSALDDQGAWPMALAERAFLRNVQGGCNAPVGAHAERAGGNLHVRARVLALDGSDSVSASRTGPVAEAEALGEGLAQEMLDLGAGPLIDKART
tara:strand:+ start:10235 stop:11152 length:918 start_codon:yes stop_codon:yes gene_type:complete